MKNPFAIVLLGLSRLMTGSVTGPAAQDPSAPPPRATISNRLPPRDTDGRIVDVHDGCLHKFGDLYYLYGTGYGTTDGFNKNNRYRCYSSADLVTWKYEGELLKDPPDGVYYRPYVVHNKKTGTYVLWYNCYVTLWDGQYGVATSDQPLAEPHDRRQATRRHECAPVHLQHARSIQCPVGAGPVRPPGPGAGAGTNIELITTPKESMTPRRRVLAAMRRTVLPDRCPFEISWGAFTSGLMKVYRERTGSALDPCEHFDFDTRSVNLAPTRKQTDFRRLYPQPIPDNVAFDEWGVGVVPGPVEHFVEFKYHPLAAWESPEQVLNFPWPDVDADYRFESLAARVADYQGRGYAVTGELYQTIFEMAWLLRGMENLLMDFLADPDLAHAICEKLTDLRIRQAVRYAELGVDILNPVQPECKDLATIGRHYGEPISFWGGIGTQSTMPFGTPEDVRQKVSEVQAALGTGGGLLLAPTHILEPEVPWENIEAFVVAAKSSRYSPAAPSDLSNQSKQS
jgi:hypothetical protein